LSFPEGYRGRIEYAAEWKRQKNDEKKCSGLDGSVEMLITTSSSEDDFSFKGSWDKILYIQ